MPASFVAGLAFLALSGAEALNGLRAYRAGQGGGACMNTCSAVLFAGAAMLSLSGSR